jgi:hypothetical protein
MASAGAGQKCETCYGEGEIPTDDGPVPCPDCGGAGTLPRADTLIEWRLREIEQVHAPEGAETAKDLHWLAFELRRARAALTELLTLTDELEETAVRSRMRFVANQALSLYEVTADEDKGPST